MSKHLLFLVHGMGIHPANQWANDVINKLTSLSQKYAFFGKHALDAFVNFVPVNYDPVFDTILSKWSHDSGNITAFAKGIGLDDADALSWLTTADQKEKNFFWTHCTDVILYRFYKNVRDAIRIEVVRQIVEALNNEYKQSNSTSMCSVMAHSLGTAVAHDCLQSLGSSPQGQTSPYAPNHFKFQNFFMLANTSNLLKTDLNPYNSLVKSGAQSDAAAYCNNFYNFRNEFDPIALTMKFKPEPAWPIGFYDISINHIHHVNVHDWLTYLDNPSVHIPILKSVSTFNAVTSAEEKQARAEFPQFIPSGIFTDVEGASSQLNKLITVFKGTEAAELIRSLITYSSVLGIDKLSSESEGGVS
jgi:hypothetical protein